MRAGKKLLMVTGAIVTIVGLDTIHTIVNSPTTDGNGGFALVGLSVTIVGLVFMGLTYFNKED